MPVGFMSEHTAEFALVPNLIRRLKPSFPSAVPFYYWASREGSRMVAAACDDYVSIIAAYARRPKVDEWGQPVITVKINKELFDHAAVLAELGVPVLAGAPRVSTLTDFSLDSACAWFLLLTSPHAPGDQIMTLDIRDPASASLDRGLVQGPLDDADIRRIAGQARPLPWPDAFGLIRSANRALHAVSPRRYPFLGGATMYKPFYLALSTEPGGTVASPANQRLERTGETSPVPCGTPPPPLSRQPLGRLLERRRFS